LFYVEETLKVCVDKTISGKDPYSEPRSRMAVIRGKRWEPGQTLRVKFLSGNPQIKEKVQDKAKYWLNYANVKFDFVSDGDAEIRIDFKKDGSWSYIGIDAKDIPQSEPTMNFGWLEETPLEDDAEYSRVVKHEFGHALGAIHEHQNPAANIPWNKPAVYEYYMGPPNNWSKEDVDHNLFDRYSQNITNFTRFDASSIMLYPVPKQFTTNNIAIGGRNTDPSETDKEFMRTQYAV
jgi:serralysin